MMNSIRVQLGRWVYLILSGIFTLCTLIQIYLAGMAVFINPSNWAKHTLFGHIFLSIIPVLMLIFAVIGSLPHWAYWQILGLFGFVFLMYFTANISFVMPMATPLHPVFAFGLLLLTISSTLRTWQLLRKARQKESERTEAD